MAAIFQLRRGSGSVSLIDGELYVNKGPDSLQYSVNDREITLAKLDELNTGSLNLSGDITASNAYFTNDVKIDGKITVGNETGDTLNIVASLSSSLIPSGSTLFDLGSTTNYYKNLYVQTISSSFISGSIAGIGNIETFSASVDNRLDIVEATASLYIPFSTSVDSRLDLVEATASYLNTTFSTSVNSRFVELETKSASVESRLDQIGVITGSLINSASSFESRNATLLNYTSSVDTRLTEIGIVTGSLITSASANRVSITNINVATASLQTKSASVDISISNLHSYTASLNGAIQLTGSTVSFLGDIVVYGTQSIINSENLAVADNLIYLNNDSFVTNPDLGIVGNYNDGTYAHTGIYRDALDGVWRVFKSYTPEPSGNIDLSHASFRYADFYANALSASTLSGIGNVTSYSTSVNSRLVELETKSASVDVSVTNLNLFTSSQLTQNSTLATYTASVSTRLTEIGVVTGSLIISASADRVSITNINVATASLQTTSASVNTSISNLNTYTSSVNTILAEIGNVTSSLINSASAVSNSVWNVHQFTSSQLTQNLDLATYTGSVSSRLTEIGIVTGSLILSASAVSSSVWSLNRFSASATNSIVELYSTASDHETRIDYLEGVAFGGIDLEAQFAALAIVTSSLQSFTASANVRLNNLESTSASLLVQTSNLETFSASALVSITNLNASSASQQVSINALNQFTASQSTASLVTSISNLNSFTASQLTQNVNLATVTGSLINSASNASTRLDALETETFNLEVHTASVNSRFTTLASYTASVNTTTASLNSYTQSTDVRLTNIESFTSSINTTIKNKLNADGVISGSSQILGNSTIHSGSIGNYQFNSIGIGTAPSNVEGELRATGDIVAFYSSDVRLKENINPIVDALSKVESISGKTYDWKEGFETIHSHKGHDLGVIAQEVQSVLPEIVTERETGYLAVDYIKLVPVLIEAIKELSSKIKELEKN